MYNEIKVKLCAIGLDEQRQLSLALDENGNIPSLFLPNDATSKASCHLVSSEHNIGRLSHLHLLSIADSPDSGVIQGSRLIDIVYFAIVDETLKIHRVPVAEIRKLNTSKNPLSEELTQMKKACDFFADTMESKNLATVVMPTLFNMSDLISVYRQAWPECKIDEPNFRRKIIKSATIQDTGELVQGAKAYTATMSNQISPPFNRSALRKSVV